MEDKGKEDKLKKLMGKERRRKRRMLTMSIIMITTKPEWGRKGRGREGKGKTKQVL